MTDTAKRDSAMYQTQEQFMDADPSLGLTMCRACGAVVPVASGQYAHRAYHGPTHWENVTKDSYP